MCAAGEAASSAAKETRAEVDALLARLPALDSRAACDELAVAFCYVNSKAARRRLVRVPHGKLLKQALPFPCAWVSVPAYHWPWRAPDGSGEEPHGARHCPETI